MTTKPRWAFVLGRRLRGLLDGKRLKAADKEWAAAYEENQQMEQFVADQERVKRWKVSQMKCQFFSSAYLNDKTSRVPEVVNNADDMLENVIQKVLAEADAVKGDTYCRSAILHSLSELMCKTGHFVRTEKVIELITVDIIRKQARKTVAEEQSKLLRRVCEVASGSG